MKHTVFELILENDARGLLVHIPDASVVSFDFNFRAGEYLVERRLWETPHLMEHLLLGANEFIPRARAFQAEVEKNGAYSNASTGAYDITYEAECADFEWDRILGLLLISITKPLFLAEEFEAEAGNVREELTARSNNHFRHLNLALRERYGLKSITDQERLTLMSNVNLNDVREHYERTHTSSNLRFVIGGNLTAKRRKVIEKLIGSIDLPRGDGRTELPVERPSSLSKPLYIHNDTVENVYFYLDTFMLRRTTDPESDALGLINTMLTETLYSLILGTAREKGLAYNVSSGFGQTNTSTNWWFGAQVMPRNAPGLFKIIIHELEEVFAGRLSDDQIEAAKQYSLGRFQRSAQTVSGTAGGYTYRYFFDGVIDDYYKIPDRIKAVEKRAIVAISKAQFADAIWGFGGLGNCGEEFIQKLHSQIRQLW